VWCNNDYLGMGQHRDVLAAMHRAIDHPGAGGAGNISGTNRQHVQLETELADRHGKAGALIFTSGWISNLAALGTLGRPMPDCAVFADALNHNSMIEGIRRSGAERFIFRHNDVAHSPAGAQSKPQEAHHLPRIGRIRNEREFSTNVASIWRSMAQRTQ
jgi:5-aminolevulinate synthase